ncbi:GNAT family N-acetyltransferase [Arenibacter sp. BSSL-BM3]|uniref:GNAT family N-acetyltransferase n=1 Tax=Arenibacter arenosicollis TaxID=2762274 RepID=A0ABR7QLL7_9FLAO|nr:GNAT family N-acetyltransferase [Arenibacter arenosicollis]MBC8767852.1 GNAT family N-acetyltransferase [Arenibacter arenosicollis]
MRRKEIDLFVDLFEKENGIPEIYAGVEFVQKNKMAESQITSKSFFSFYSIKFVPDYLLFPLAVESLFYSKKLYQVKGYSARLDDVSDIASYVKSQFRSNAKTINRYVNRLESCFDIDYKMYYGQINKDTYNFLMDSLYDMMLKRFNQLQIPNESEAKWEHTRKTIDALIHKKRASLFVIYDGLKPIEISINYHFRSILFSSISSYDIDYSKFGLGHVEIYKQIEWCLANDYKVFEMGRGDLDYKRRWSNQIYNFEHHIIYKKDSVYGRLWSLKEEYINQLKLYLKSKNIDLIYKNLKGKLTTESGLTTKALEYNVETLNTEPSIDNLPIIDIHLEANAFLKKYVYDFLYTNTEHLSQVNVFNLEREQAYIIKGNKTSVKISEQN